jgi:hypothetical protein
MQARKETIEYEVGQRARKRVEGCFGLPKTIAGLDRSRWVGHWKLQQYFDIKASTYNLQPTAADKTAANCMLH